ncbi:MAG TPA: hypothetical protein VD866_07510 [Urbifossiella sp.]|nr:hypothetical protein [Urbifossiella sp.]
MRVVGRLVAALLGLLGTTGTILCAAGLVGVWVLHSDLVGRADRVFGRAEDRLATARADLGRVAERLQQARREIEAVEKRDEKLAAPAVKRHRTVLPPSGAASASNQLGQARQILVTATEVGLVADGVLDVLAELPASERVGIDTARLRDASAQLSDLIRTADRLSAALPRPADAPDDHAAGIADRVGRVAATLDEAAGNVHGVRERVVDWHRRTVRALNIAAVVATALLVWIGLGQACLANQGVRRCFRRAAAAGVTPSSRTA